MRRFQEQLLTGLADGASTQDLVQEAQQGAPDAAVAEWVAGWDPDLVDLAGVLVRTWAYLEPR